MKHILILLASWLVATPSFGMGIGSELTDSYGAVFNEQDRNLYVNHSCYYDNFWCALAMSKDGAFGLSTQRLKRKATYKALRQCRIVANKPETCEIVDINAESDFIKKGIAKAPRSTPTSDSDRQLLSTGTGFLVDKNFIVTADHVLRMNDRGDLCNSISIMHRYDEYEASIADLDPANDIGLIKLSEPIPSTATIRGRPDVRLGEKAINYGFPLTGQLSSSAKITSGAVNSLAGYNNNSAFIQYDAASQFGNSGGPVLDASGNVIGVVSAKLDDAENQLVNFATKSTILEGFLKANKVPFEKADLGDKLELPDIAEKAEAFTVLVGCWE